MNHLQVNIQTGQVTVIPFTAQEEAEALAKRQIEDAEAAVRDAHTARVNAIQMQARADQVIDKLRTATLQEIVDYVNTNVTDLASAKDLLTKLAIGVAYAIRND